MIEGFELTEDYIQFVDGAENWEEAIRVSAQPLLVNEKIKDSYIDGMINSVKEFGPYIVIAPNLAMPHARPEAGALEVGYCITLMKEPVSFAEDGSSDAQVFITLACVSDTTHLEMMQQIVMILSEQEKFDALFNAETKQEIIDIFKN